MSHTLTVRLDATLAARLAEAAERAKQPVSTLVRNVVSEWLDEVGPRRPTTLLGAAGSISGRGVSATNANVRASFRAARRRTSSSTGPLVAPRRRARSARLPEVDVDAEARLPRAELASARRVERHPDVIGRRGEQGADDPKGREAAVAANSDAPRWAWAVGCAF